jgi:cyclin-dependent kinase-like
MAHSRVWECLNTPDEAWIDDYEFWYTDCAQSKEFIVTDVLGHGTFGDVYSARDVHTGEVRALKRSRVIHDVGDEPSREIIQEASILSRLRGEPHVVQIESFEFGKWIVQECMFDSLQNLLSKRHATKLSTADCHEIILQLLKGLEECHSHNIVHRDLKPGNILVNVKPSLRVKICDFGMAKVMHPRAFACHTPEVVTLWYRAPELLEARDMSQLELPISDNMEATLQEWHSSKKRQSGGISGKTDRTAIYHVVPYGKEIDYWAAGCVAYEAFNRRPLYPGDSEISVLAMIAKSLHRTEPSPYFPFFDCLLEVDPMKRGGLDRAEMLLRQSIQTLSTT